MRAGWLGIGAAAAVLAAAPWMTPCGHGRARAASFDCARAANPSERAICANPALSALDKELGAWSGPDAEHLCGGA